MSINMYWSVYKNLERDVLKLADYLLFTDNQLQVYSVFIADLIVRCAIEIEALSKELYKDNGGPESACDADGKTPDLFFDTDCLNFLNKKWKLTEKKIIVAASNFFFEDENNRILQPLKKSHKRGSSGSNWKQAYQAVKHDRKNSIKKATVKNLIYALGSLYILNIYYKVTTNETVRIHDFDYSQGSQIFTAFSVDATLVEFSPKITDDKIADFASLPHAIFVKKFADDTVKSIADSLVVDFERMSQLCTNEPSIQKYLSENPDKTHQNNIALIMSAGGMGLLQKLQIFSSTNKSLQNKKLEIICYKNEGVYSDNNTPSI